MKRFIFRLVATAFFAAGLFPTIPGARGADLTHDQVVAAKTATAFLVSGDGSGTAFCISESGLFVTCNHVVKDAKPGDDLFVVINPSAKDEKKLPAKVLRTFPDCDLAIIKVDLDRKIPVLKLGDDSELVETQALIVFGYPFGEGMASDEKSYPAISVNSGRVTALRKIGDMPVIQLDAVTNPGNSGGPVLDDKGTVVGILAAGLPGAGMNFAVPVSLLIKAMSAPLVSVDVPEVKYDDRYKPVDFVISVDWLSPPAGEQAVTLEITSGGQVRRVAAAKGSDGKYHASAPPLIAKPAPAKIKLNVTLQFENGTVSGQIDDFPVLIQGKQKPLSEIQTIAPVENGAGFLADGAPAGSLPELAAMKVDIGGGAVTTVDGRKATRIDIELPRQESEGPVSYKAIVTVGGPELASAQGDVKIHSKPVAYAPSQLTPSPPISSKPISSKPISPQPPPVRRAPPEPAPSQLIGVTDLGETKSFDLPSPADDVVAAQDGRALVFHLKDTKKLAVFDVVDLKFRGFINLDQEPALFAGGSRCIIVAYPSENIIERYSLLTLKKDSTITNPMGELQNLSMGYASPRDAMFVTKGNRFAPEIDMFDTDTMTVAASSKDNDKFNRLGGSMNTHVLVRSSGDGRTYGIFRLGVSPSGFSVVCYKNDELSLSYEHQSTGVLVPNANGTEIFTCETGIFSPQYVSVVKSTGNRSNGTCYLPSYSPSYFISVPYSETESPKKSTSSKPIAIYTEHSAQPLIYLDGFDEMSVKDAGLRSSAPPMTPDKRYHFYPQLNLFITIPATNNRIVTHPIDLKKTLDAKGIDYLYATCVPPLARVSQYFTFKITAVSKAGSVTFSLQSGPQGLTVGSDGTVNWQTPAKPTEESVIVTMKDASGQETL